MPERGFIMSPLINDEVFSKKSMIGKKILESLLFITAAFIISILINIFILEIAVVEGSSMENTLYSGEKLIIFKFGYFFNSPANNDIVYCCDAI